MKDEKKSPFSGSLEESYRKKGNSVVKALIEKGHKAKYVETPQEALKEVLSLIPFNTSVGIPGSVTIREIGALEALESRGNKVIHHWDPSLTPETRPGRLQDENLADVILTSSNALTLDGMLVNIDGNGNRVSAMSWGNNSIIYVVGINKLEKNLDCAIQRVRDCATPPNAMRLNIETPCAKTGHCMECNVPERVCRALLILERAVFGRDSTVIIVGQPLGY